MQVLELPGNDLRGSIHSYLGKLSSLTDLVLNDNHLTGTIPDLSSLTSLRELFLSQNNLRGPIPPHLSKLTQLRLLHLDRNQLTGPLPTKPDPNDATRQVIDLPDSLTTVSLYNNQLSGQIPDLSSLTSLRDLFLRNNQLSGQIPALPDSIRQLHLSDNQLSGTIPALPASLVNLRLENNKLSGMIPTSLPSSLGYLDLSNNKLSRTIPDLSGLSSLNQLYLNNNQLGGMIPTSTSLPSSLSDLRLQNNQLSGEIPDLSSLSSLGILFLNNNKLTGSLSASFLPPSLSHFSLYGNTGLDGYPSSLPTSLYLVVPGDGTAACLPTTSGGTDCTIPTKVDKLLLRTTPTQISAYWVQPIPAPDGYVVEYYQGVVWPWAWESTNIKIVVPPAPHAAAAFITGLTPGQRYPVRVRPDSADTPWLYSSVTLPERSGTTDTGTTDTGTTDTGTGDTGGTGGTGGGGAGGGGGTRTPTDRHGDTPEDATSLNPRRYTTGPISRTITAHLQSRRDIDYFTLDLPYAGLLTASTTGADTTGRLYQAQDEGEPRLVAEDTDSGRGSNFALGTSVEAGTYYLAVLAGRGSGEYRLSVHYTPAFVDNPGPDSPQSGVSVLSGWVCEADTVEIEFETPGAAPQTWVPATGTSRADTAVACGPRTTDTGYGLLFNWNRLGDGQHTVRVIMDDVVLAEREITVTTLGEHPEQEFRKDLAASTDIPDFPAVGEVTTLRWQTARQNFMIASGDGGGGGQQLTPEQAWLGNPAPGSFQSGVGVLSGWVCEADTVTLEIETAAGTTFTEEAGYGTERGDTAGVCGDTDNGFGLLYNWNRLGDGQHTVRAYADGEEFAHSTFTVTTLGEEFPKGLAQTHDIEDFPAEGQTTTVEWQTGQQNFVITGVE